MALEGEHAQAAHESGRVLVAVGKEEQDRAARDLAQEELAQLLGASRQRVNQELKSMEREEAIRIEPGGLVIRDRAALMQIIESDH